MKKTPMPETHPNVPIFLKEWFKDDNHDSLSKEEFYMMSNILWAIDKRRGEEKCRTGANAN